jgi:hypothetical protein
MASSGVLVITAGILAIFIMGSFIPWQVIQKRCRRKKKFTFVKHSNLLRTSLALYIVVNSEVGGFALACLKTKKSLCQIFLERMRIFI